MKPIVIDPDTYDSDIAKRHAWDTIVAEFCDANGIKKPLHVLDDKMAKGMRAKGWCDRTSIYASKGKKPAKVPGWSWSFTGYKADMTAYGIVAHELGHWFHFTAGPTKEIIADFVANSGKKPVSSYEPNAHESFAESTRLYILNPDLLSQACPERFSALEKLGMKTLVNAGWKEILANAGAARISAAEKWILR